MQSTVWIVDNLETIGGHAVSVEGTPTVIDSEQGKAVRFDGVRDGLYLDVNPIEGDAAFTVEILFRPDDGGETEQRFLHIQEAQGENRVLVELRAPGDGTWYGDTYIQSGSSAKPLNDPALTHPVGQWHTIALVYDGQQMRQYVDGVLELVGEVAAVPMAGGRTSLGVRQNKVSWFKGAMRQVRFTPTALAPEALLKP